MISFKTTKLASSLINQIVARAYGMNPNYKPMDCSMDITACHCNGSPLDLKKLLEAPDIDFAHDVFGIRNHINRTTGELGDFFLPRCSAKKLEKAR